MLQINLEVCNCSILTESGQDKDQAVQADQVGQTY